MRDPHEPLGAFLDGELTDAEASEFRVHLGGCAQCQADLRDFGALDAVLMRAPPAVKGRSRPVPQVLISAVLIAAGLALTVFLWPSREATPLVPRLADARQLEARVTWAVGDAWRPYRPSRGASSPEPVSAADLAALEAAGDVQALAGAWLLSGNPLKAEQVLGALSPQTASDLSAVALSRGDDEAALVAAQWALDALPNHPQASWNAALALEHLGLIRLAAKRLHQIEAAAEPGWSTEAAARARALDAQWQSVLERTQRALDAGAKMVLFHQPMADAEARAMPSWARMNLRYALLTAENRAQIEALAPLAHTLDALFNSTDASAAVTRLANRKSFAQAATFRALIVDYYRALIATGFAPAISDAEPGLGEGTVAWVRALRRSHAWEELLFAIPMGRQLEVAFDDYAQAVQRDGDGWFTLSLEIERARRSLREGEAAEAERRWLEVVSAAEHAPLRALQAREQLAMLLINQHRVEEGHAQLMAAMSLARAQGDQASVVRMLHVLADASRFRNVPALAAAAQEERILRLPELEAPRDYLHESMASVAVLALDPARARRELAQVTGPLTLLGASVLADLLQLAPQAGDADRLKVAIAALRADPATQPGEAVWLTHLEARALVLERPREAKEALRASIVQAQKMTAVDALPGKAIAHGFGLLRLLAAREGDWNTVLALSAEETGSAPGATCTLVVEVQDNSVAVAARDAQGATSGASHAFPFGHRLGAGLSVEEISTHASPVATIAASGCTRLSVSASYPLHGRAGWLPDDVAWAFSRGRAVGVPVGNSTLVVRDVKTPPALGLPALASWEDVARDGVVELSGEAATPRRVLEAMRHAALIELHAHAQVNLAEADTASLILAADDDGRFTLDARRLVSSKLEAHPVVVLAACRASTVAPYLHAPWSLPNAFLTAGASSVIAAPVDLPDDEARIFFGAVVARLRAGQDAATAVRDERLSWLTQHRANWVRKVLVFD